MSNHNSQSPFESRREAAILVPLFFLIVALLLWLALMFVTWTWLPWSILFLRFFILFEIVVAVIAWSTS